MLKWQNNHQREVQGVSPAKKYILNIYKNTFFGRAFINKKKESDFFWVFFLKMWTHPSANFIFNFYFNFSFNFNFNIKFNFNFIFKFTFKFIPISHGGQYDHPSNFYVLKIFGWELRATSLLWPFIIRNGAVFKHLTCCLPPVGIWDFKTTPFRKHPKHLWFRPKSIFINKKLEDIIFLMPSRHAPGQKKYLLTIKKLSKNE